MARLHVMTPKSLKEQKRLNRAAKAAMKDLSVFKKKHMPALKQLMWGYDMDVLTAAIKLVHLELRNQTLTI